MRGTQSEATRKKIIEEGKGTADCEHAKEGRGKESVQTVLVIYGGAERASGRQKKIWK